MKVIKLDNRYKQYKDHRHQVGFRFEAWNDQAHQIEKILRGMYRTGGWDRSNDWYSYFGTAPSRTGTRPFFITMRDESVSSMVLLLVGNSSEK